MLETCTFPEGTTGFQLDAIARYQIWKSGLDYRHGTGHGVGSFLNVHEGPHCITFRISANDVPLKPGMTVTNEPGYYEDNDFGIRIENIMLVKEVKGLKNFGDKKYFGFENITMVPIDIRLLDMDLLSQDDIKYINTFHKKCLELIGPIVKDDQLSYDWLVKSTKPILT